jgi:hypothetical protein
MPFIDGRAAALVQQALEIGEADAFKVDWRAALRHSAGLRRRGANDN